MHIVVEGQDGTGKDTQIKKLVDFYRTQGKEVVFYSESGTGSSDPFVLEVARLNYGSKQDIDCRTRVMLYLTNRYEQWRKLAEPCLKRGGIVITARSWISTLIYEGYVGGVSRSLITRMHKLVMPEKYFSPDKIFILTINEAEQAKRLGAQTNARWDRKNEYWKSQGGVLQKKLNSAYLNVAKTYHIPTIDASGTIDEVFAAIMDYLE